jgi:hypothetical protein
VRFPPRSASAKVLHEPCSPQTQIRNLSVWALRVTDFQNQRDVAKLRRSHLTGPYLLRRLQPAMVMRWKIVSMDTRGCQTWSTFVPTEVYWQEKPIGTRSVPRQTRLGNSTAVQLQLPLYQAYAVEAPDLHPAIARNMRKKACRRAAGSNATSM